MEIKRDYIISSYIINKYNILNQLGEEGKEGLCYCIQDKKTNKKYALKIFRKNKSIKNINIECKYLIKASEINIAPKIIYKTDRNIIMELMNNRLLDVLKEQNNILTNKQIDQIIYLYIKLSELGILHNDDNISRNILLDSNNNFKLIDFGLSRKAKQNSYDKYGPYPNLTLLSKLYKLCNSDYLREFINNYETENNVIIDYRNYQINLINKRKQEYLSKFKS